MAPEGSGVRNELALFLTVMIPRTCKYMGSLRSF
nr:MAG TPA: hypothetical protein [Caudoviricetes sp.]